MAVAEQVTGTAFVVGLTKPETMKLLKMLGDRPYECDNDPLSRVYSALYKAVYGD